VAPEPYSWSWNPEALVVVPALTVGYVVLLRRHPAERWRQACFAGAMVLVLAVTVTPIETISLNYLLSVHLVQNVVLAEWAPLLFVLAIPAGAAATLPRVPPVPALVLWVVNYMAWHLPWVYDAALRHPHTLLHLEHAAYFATGVLLWWPVVHAPLSPGPKATYVFAAPERVWGLDPLRDQQIAGVAMSLSEALVFFAVFAWFFVRFFQEQDAVA
jgi:cytochrome c oxidase assembly factor CtaG